MSFFKKLFNSLKSVEVDDNSTPIKTSVDDIFVDNFLKKGGKFLYCTTTDEVVENIRSIIIENDWKHIICNDFNLKNLIHKTPITVKKELNNSSPFFTTCEYLISDSGDIMFSSNQLSSKKLSSLSNNFIVYSTTSQIVKNTREALSGIKATYSGNIPTNISSVKDYSFNKNDDDFMNYGNMSSKNLYLLLFEDL